MTDEVAVVNQEESKLIQWISTKYDKIKNNWFSLVESKKAEGVDIKNLNIIPIISNYLSVDNRTLKLNDRLFDKVEEVELCFELYKDIVSNINLSVVYIPSQQSFCMFMGWTDKAYKVMLTETEEDIKDLMQMVDAYLFECQIGAAQSGFAGQSSTKYRSQIAGEKGMNLITQKEQNITEHTTRKVKSHDELIKELQGMGGLLGIGSTAREAAKEKTSKSVKNKKSKA